VWLKFFETGAERPVDLLLNPCRGRSPGELRLALQEALKQHDAEAASGSPRWMFRSQTWQPGDRKPMVYNESHLAAELWPDELIRCALPLTKWWQEYVWRTGKSRPEVIGSELATAIEEAPQEFSEDLLWLVKVLGYFVRRNAPPEWLPDNPSDTQLGLSFLEGLRVPPPGKGRHLLWSVSLNRPASIAVRQSCPAVKADAAVRLFQMSCKELCWGVVDSGVDATHPAFRRRNERGKPLEERDQQSQLQSRVYRTYDFSRLRSLLDPEGGPVELWDEETHADFPREVRQRLKNAQLKMAEARERLRHGRMLEWDELEPCLRVPHDRLYKPPKDEHGTHVAGILGGHWKKADGAMPADEKQDLVGMCPDIGIYDLRVFNEKGEGTEFEVLAALQLVRFLNANQDQPVVQGVNISLSIPHEVSSFACGRTPVCEECIRLVGNGVVVVAAAGNQGYTGKLGASLGIAAYQDISITDPGNAEDVITVGATHRHMPHTYGVSYFSSRGPTGDGRHKPDLVAPGEKIKSTVPGGGLKSLDGTSMAAPHVSGAAALLMARHTELIGQPARIKGILCRTATDLGRDRYFQGSGMVDILRAIQSV
jgi:hypothetical protein